MRPLFLCQNFLGIFLLFPVEVSVKFCYNKSSAAQPIRTAPDIMVKTPGQGILYNKIF
jgi:hypothetical protein